MENILINTRGVSRSEYEELRDKLYAECWYFEELGGDDIGQLKSSLYVLIQTMKDVLKKSMPSKGNREDECQRLCILNRIADVQKSVNGISNEDLFEDM